MDRLKRVNAVLLAICLIFICVGTTAEVNAASVKLNKTNLTLKVGQTYTLKVKGTSKKVVWKSSDTKIVSVSKKGVVKAKKAGSAAVTAKVAGKTLKCKVTVKAKAVKPLTTYWSSDSEAAERLRDYVTKVTDENDKENFIPKRDRIAVFDMDGTLMCETYFIYYDTMMFIDYCDNYLADNQFLTEEEKAELWRAASVIKPNYKAQRDLAENFAKAYSGMTVQELYDYAAEFGRKTTVSFLDSRNVDGHMQYKDGFYLPMVEVVKYLYDNGFTIYVVSGTERTTTRAIVDNSPISDYVTPNHVIGTEFEVKLEGHENDHWNDDYKYGENGKDDKLVITGFIQKNLNANKTIYIDREIGQRPVLAFGNSGSDTSMLNYALINNKYPSEAYMLIADDTVREWGSENAWEDNADKYRAMGYTPVSMKNEFLQIYPEEFISRSDIQYIPKNNDAAQQDNALQDVA